MNMQLCYQRALNLTSKLGTLEVTWAYVIYQIHASGHHSDTCPKNDDGTHLYTDIIFFLIWVSAFLCLISILT